MPSDGLQITDAKRENLLHQLQPVVENVELESKCKWESEPKNVAETQVCVPLTQTASPEPRSPFSGDSEQRRKFEAIHKGSPPPIYHDSTFEVRYTTSDHILQEGSEMRRYDYLPEFEHEHVVPCDKEKYRDIELRGSILYKGCDCVRRNGLQHDCPRTGCRNQTCLNKPEPDCIPSGGCGIKGPAPKTRKHPPTYHSRRVVRPRTLEKPDPICRAEVPCTICDPPKNSPKDKYKVLCREEVRQSCYSK